jgi:3-dehydroquinate dehydratase-2
MKPLYILNGPNLNRLGRGAGDLRARDARRDRDRVQARRRRAAAGVSPDEQRAAADRLDSRSERRRRGHHHQPRGYSFTSIAILDALKMFKGPIIELHITNIHRREDHYHHSYISKIATAVIAGLGPGGYVVAVHAMTGMVRDGTMQLGHDWA